MIKIRDLELFDDILATPLFLGMSRADLLSVLSGLRLSIKDRKANEVLAAADTPCNRLVIVLRGQVNVVTASSGHAYKLTETLSAPFQCQVERMFGRHTAFGSTVSAATPCNTLTLPKKDVLTLYNTYEIFRLNLLNMLTLRLQKEEICNWMERGSGLRRSIVDFVIRRCAYPAGKKLLSIKMIDLAAELNSTRIDVSDELNSLQDEGLVVLHRGIIEIPALEDLYLNAAR
ncbi:MAG: cyclic nucleotide-binding domain-containing protein [Prevotella sp.]|nr:cyclic nucleotide-binding domain-containing protein [Prevotella sp.]